MPFRVSIKNHLKKLENLDIEMIAPSHGPIYRDPSFIMNAYKDWTSDDVKSEVVVAYVSMHGSTEALVRRFVDILVEKGVSYTVVAAFSITLMMVGILTFSVEREYFGTKVTIVRNLISFVIAVAVAVIIGIVFGEFI